jgi:hypothetical protein
MAEADGLQAVQPLKTSQEPRLSMSDRNNARDPIIHKRAGSWPGGADAKYPKTPQPEGSRSKLENDTQKSQEITLGMETAHLESDGRYHGTENEVLGQASKTPTANSASPGGNGGRRKQQNRQEGPAKYKETKSRRLRWRVLKLRATVAEKRRELTHARLDVIYADDDFMKLVRQMRIQQPDTGYEGSALFEHHYSKLQAARDKYGLLEETYGILEERLNREEYEITQLEEELDVDDEDCSEHHTDDSGISSRNSDDGESDNPTFTKNGQYALYDEYLSKLGDADLVHEDLIELRVARRNLQEFQASRKKVRLELSPEDQETLDNYAAEKSKLLGQLKEIKADAERLRIQCVESGLMEAAAKMISPLSQTVR